MPTPPDASSGPACALCGRTRPDVELIQSAFVRPAIAALIREAVPDWSDDDFICTDDLHGYRIEHMRRILEAERGELAAADRHVLASLEYRKPLSVNVLERYDEHTSLGERWSDRLASFGGSWTFLGLFASTLIVWMLVNTVVLTQQPFDPYPFILLNLVLSCLAAIQAPIIMMSQNRQESKDRLRAEHDYQVNLKAELEIRQMHERFDHLFAHQWQRLMDLQEIQTELIDEIARRPPPSAPSSETS